MNTAELNCTEYLDFPTNTYVLTVTGPEIDGAMIFVIRVSTLEKYPKVDFQSILLDMFQDASTASTNTMPPMVEDMIHYQYPSVQHFIAKRYQLPV